jgi:hypothetical protein
MKASPFLPLACSELPRPKLWLFALVLLSLCQLPLPPRFFPPTLLTLLLLPFKATPKKSQDNKLPVSIATTVSTNPPSRTADAAAIAMTSESSGGSSISTPGPAVDSNDQNVPSTSGVSETISENPPGKVTMRGQTKKITAK